MPDADTKCPSVDTLRSPRRTAAATLSIRTLAAGAAIAALWAAFAPAFAQVIGDAVQNCGDCVPEGQAGRTRRLLEVPAGILSADDIARLMRTLPAGRSFSIANGSGLDLAALGGEEAFLEAYDYVVARTGATLERTILLRIGRRATSYCPTRGLAWPATQPAIEMFLTETPDRTEALGILAHEIGHIAQALGLPPGDMSGDAGFDQGFATWAAGRYWTDMLGFGSFAEAVASYRAAGTYLPLATFPEGAFPSPSQSEADAASDASASAACLAKRDVWFTSWAGFIDHLVERFGMERLLALLQLGVNGATTTGWRAALDYETVYGATLETLEADWLRVMAGREGDASAPTSATRTQ